MKTFRVTYGLRHDPLRATVVLEGLEEDAPIRPAMARQVARIACGHEFGVTVVDNKTGNGYRLYSDEPNSHRKVKVNDGDD